MTKIRFLAAAGFATCALILGACAETGTDSTLDGVDPIVDRIGSIAGVTGDTVVAELSKAEACATQGATGLEIDAWSDFATVKKVTDRCAAMFGGTLCEVHENGGCHLRGQDKSSGSGDAPAEDG